MKQLFLKVLNRSIMAFDRVLTRKKKETVNQDGRKECIEEMIEKFGIEPVRIFCLLNAYKHDYRHKIKGGDEELANAEWYMKKYAKLGGDAVE